MNNVRTISVLLTVNCGRLLWQHKSINLTLVAKCDLNDDDRSGRVGKANETVLKSDKTMTDDFEC
jgi:hypothetical protein